MNYTFSFIIPVYNRPEEIKELLESCLEVVYIEECEVIIIEDGSSVDCEQYIKQYATRLHISYYKKTNTGPGDSRNFGMKLAKSTYFLILDSDVILPKNYLINIKKNLQNKDVHCFGGVDKAHESFSVIQKAIDYTLTSIWSTGGIRGKKGLNKGYQPRSFNMGLSKEAFDISKGFRNIHPGEDPDLSLRLRDLGYTIALYWDVYVFHKRRVSWRSFSRQIYKFGLVRPILNLWHPKSHKITYYFPTLFSVGFVVALGLSLFGFYWFFALYVFYYIVIFLDSWIQYKNLSISINVLLAVSVQFFSYGYAFIKSTISILVLKNKPEITYPRLFYFKNLKNE